MLRKTIAVFLLFVCYGTVSGFAQQAAPISCQPTTDTVTRKFKESLVNIFSKHPESVGIMVHVESAKRGISWSGSIGYSNKNEKTPIDWAQPALIASNTKSYVSAAILRLVEQKKLTTDQPIQNLISTKSADLLSEDGYDLSAIQVSHLLTHTSGLHDYIDDGYMQFAQDNPKHRWTREEQITRAIEIGKPLGQPNSVFQYADINYLLLGEILETITERPFYSAVRELLRYDELGLSQTWFETLEERPLSVKPLVHQYFSTRKFDSWEVDPSFDLYGAGGIAATTSDLAKFSQLLFSGKIIQDEKVLKSMLTPAKTTNGDNHFYHFGLSSSEIVGVQAYGHGGFWGTVVQHLPDLDASIAVYILERDHRILRKNILESFVEILKEDSNR